MAKEWWEYDGNESIPDSAYVPWYEREPEEKEADDDYSAVRSGVVGFVEAATGAGDELDATVRLLVGEADNWEDAIGQSRAKLEAFEEDNPLLSGALDISGLAAGLFIPGASLAKFSQAATKGARVAQGAAIGAAEGAAYGFLGGEGEERLTGAAMGAGLGAGLGGVAGRFLTRGADEIEEPLRRAVEREDAVVNMGGDEGFNNVTRATSGVGDLDGNSLQRKVTRVEDEAPASIHEDPKSGSNLIGNLVLGTREWVDKNVSTRAGRLAEDSEIMVRQELNDIDVKFDEGLFATAREMFENDKQFKSLFTRMSESIDADNRVTFDLARKLSKSKEQTDVINFLELETKALQAYDFVRFDRRLADYFPTQNIGKRSGTATPDDYVNPIDALKDLAKDISAARAVARRHNLSMGQFEDEATDLIALKKTGKPMSRMNFVINKIRNETQKQAARQKDITDPSAIADNYAEGLRSILISSKVGGDAVGATVRRGISAALLANPINAILNLIEGVTSPIYQNGIIPVLQTVPKAILATFNKELGSVDPKWLSNKQLGLDKQYMGELQAATKQTVEDGADLVKFARLPQFITNAVDKVGEFAYNVSGVRTVNRMSQEILTNSSIRQGINLAKKGDEKSLEKLRKHAGMRGLSESEFNKTVEALKQEDLTNGWVVNFAGASLNKWQPVSASTMPKAYNDNPDFRVMYSMLSYMNRQMNNLRTEVGLNLKKAQEKGLNTREGAEAARAAMLNSAKYVGLFGVVAGVWDDGRKTLDFTNDKYLEDVLTPEGFASATMNQLVSNMTSGVYNIRAEEYGGQAVSITPAPLTAASRTLSAAPKLFEGDVDPMLRSLQTYTPGLATIDRIIRMTPVLQEQLGRERLLTDN